MIYVIHRKHVFDGGSMRSWNAVTAYSEVYRTGIKNMVWSKDFHYKREAVAWCKENGLPYMTDKEWSELWLATLDEAFPLGGDFYRITAELLNLRVFAKNPPTKLLKNGKVKVLKKKSGENKKGEKRMRKNWVVTESGTRIDGSYIHVMKDATEAEVREKLVALAERRIKRATDFVGGTESADAVLGRDGGLYAFASFADGRRYVFQAVPVDNLAEFD